MSKPGLEIDLDCSLFERHWTLNGFAVTEPVVMAFWGSPGLCVYTQRAFDMLVRLSLECEGRSA